jgi:hypothetical protein
MNVALQVVPPGGGEADFSLDLDMPEVPKVGEYVMITVEGEGVGIFRVLYVTHKVRTDPEGEGGFRNVRFDGVWVQIEPVRYPLTDTAGGRMKQLFNFYAGNPRWEAKVQDFPDSGY